MGLILVREMRIIDRRINGGRWRRDHLCLRYVRVRILVRRLLAAAGDEISDEHQQGRGNDRTLYDGDPRDSERALIHVGPQLPAALIA